MRAVVLVLILAASFSVFALPAAVYNVQTYGAVGDGVTDDTLAIRAAAAALQTAAIASGVGGKLLFPPGKYLVFSPGVSPGNNNLAVFTSLKGVNVISDGATIIIGRQLATNESGLIFGFYYCNNITVDGFTVSGPSLNIGAGVPHGLNFVMLYQGNINVSMPNNKVQGVMAGMNCGRELTSQPKSQNVVIGTMDAFDSIYGLTTGYGCDDLVVHALYTKDVGRSYVAYGVKNHTVNVTSLGSFSEDVALGAPLENIKLSYTSPAEYTTGTSGSGHARIRMSFTEVASAIRNVDIRLNVVYDTNTAGGPPFRLLKYYNVSGQILENLKISGYVKGKPNNWPLGDPNGPIIGTVDSPNYWSGDDHFRNIELSNLRIENSKPVRFILNGLKGPFLIENVTSDNSVQLVQSPVGRPPDNGLYTVSNSSFPNLATYYPTEGAEPLEPINGAATLNVPVGWQGHMVSSEWVGTTVTYTLPSATKGLEYSFIRANGQVLVRPQAGQSIRGGAAGHALFLDTLGDGVKLRCVMTGIWDIISSNGSMPFVP
ncbi:MAG: glycoside hydrolase family 55 protein [Acidobacteriota bacterium]|nr:glycoside hydrolase family 55 protein [Acidobacteriota bacterium]